MTLIFGMSASLRLVSATLNTDEAQNLETQSTEGPAEGTEPQCQTIKSLQEVLDNLRDREKNVMEAEARLKSTEVAQNFARDEIESRIIELTRVEDSLRSVLTIAKEAAEQDITKLIAVYESMKPKSAAALFQEMTPEFSAGFIARMKPEAAALIMTNLEPSVAHAVSVVMAGRNANAPKE